jgi:hypothetical protein
MLGNGLFKGTSLRVTTFFAGMDFEVPVILEGLCGLRDTLEAEFPIFGGASGDQRRTKRNWQFFGAELSQNITASIGIAP